LLRRTEKERWGKEVNGITIKRSEPQIAQAKATDQQSQANRGKCVGSTDWSKARVKQFSRVGPEKRKKTKGERGLLHEPRKRQTRKERFKGRSF